MSLTNDTRATSRVVPRFIAGCGAVVLLLATGACGSKDDGDKAPVASHQDGAQDQQGGPRVMPGANGKVAAVDGSTAQVQGSEGQVAVSWDASTTFTKEVSATLADVRVGSCVAVGPAGEPSASSTPATEVTAASVRISRKTDGSCGLGVRGPGGPGGQSGPQLDGNPPPDAPGGGERPQVRALAGAVGEVTAVTSTGFTVESAVPDGSGTEDRTSVTVTVDASTTYSTTAAGAATDVKVGACMAATGTTDDAGAVAAKAVNLSQPVDGQCGGMVRFRSGDGSTSSTAS